MDGWMDWVSGKGLKMGASPTRPRAGAAGMAWGSGQWDGVLTVGFQHPAAQCGDAGGVLGLQKRWETAGNHQVGLRRGTRRL